MATRPFMRRRLGRELLAIRNNRDLSAAKVAKSADLAESTVTRIEKATLAVRVNTIKAIVDALEVTGEHREALLSLARTASEDTWWHAYTGTLPKWFELYVDLEEEADRLSIFDPQYINGLVQTEEYARAMYLAARPDEREEEIDKLVAVRMERQRRLVEGDLSLSLIIDESALTREFGDQEVLRAQLQHLLKLSRLRRVSIQILPRRGQPGVAGGFTILDFAEESDPTVVYIEHEAGALTMERPKQIRQYAWAYGRLQAAALDPETSAVRVAQLVEEM